MVRRVTGTITNKLATQVARVTGVSIQDTKKTLLALQQRAQDAKREPQTIQDVISFEAALLEGLGELEYKS